MKVSYGNDQITISSLQYGDTFRYKNLDFMLLEPSPGDVLSKAVRLEDGKVCAFESGSLVQKTPNSIFFPFGKDS